MKGDRESLGHEVVVGKLKVALFSAKEATDARDGEYNVIEARLGMGSSEEC